MPESMHVQAATILVVDVNAEDTHKICQLFERQGHRVLVSDSCEAALDTLETERPDLILLHIEMACMGGLACCRLLKAEPRFSNIPVVFLTNSSDEAEAAFAAGGVDYLVQPVRESELLARIDTHLSLAQLMLSLEASNAALAELNNNLELRIVERTRKLATANANLRKEVRERRLLQDRLDYLSKYDFVTRMFNRYSFRELLTRALSKLTSDRPQRYFLAYLDLDQFSVINDSCGHIAGDEFLRQLAEVLKSSLTEQDAICRMGGDEFALLFAAENEVMALERARLLTRLVEDFRFVWEDEVFQEGVSIGLLELDDSFNDADHLLGVAERTCFESKAKGGGEISVYNIAKNRLRHNDQQLRWVPLIQQALKNDEFFLVGQYIQDLSGGKPKKMEVLLRLGLVQDKVLPPGSFIPIAERYHLIAQIDKWVFSQVLQQQIKRGQVMQYSVNVSGESISKESFVDAIEALLVTSRFPGKYLCFEITETSAITDLDACRRFIERFKPYGCQFSLDDFGTGTSSYGFLRHLQVDYLKIDGIFVRDMEKDKVNRMLVESVTAIARELGIKVIAECVENAEVLSMLQEMGVDYAQGYFLHRPTRLNEL
jgi:diguanylate cyclase (GGDEF)-like protein